jgi:uncharacterized membrane protein YhhN
VKTRAPAVVFVTAAGAYLLGLWSQAPLLRLAVKPLPVLALAAWLLASAAGRETYARRVAAGLGLSALGDVLLEFPSGFVAGLGAFLLAHLVYVTAFLSRTRAPRPWRALPFAAYGFAYLAYVAPGLGTMQWPVTAYVVTIMAMLWRAAACLGADPRARLGLLGALLFACSDSLIGLDRFHAPILGARYAIILLYWAGQLGLALSARSAAGVDRGRG